jgi:cytochrome P450
MLLYLLVVLGTLLISPIILALVRIYKSRVNLKFYEKQGMKVFFDPIKGVFSLYDRKLPGNEKYSNMEYMKKLSKEYDHLPGIVVNKIDDDMSAVFLHDPEYIKEFLLQEEKFDKGSMEKGWPDHAGFWVYNGDKAAKSKAIFSDVFNYDALSTFTPKLCEMIIDCFRDFNNQQKVESTSFKTVDLNDLCTIIFERVLNLLIFGQVEMEPTVLGKSVYQTVMDNFHLIPAVRRNPLFVLFPAIAAKFRLCKEYHQSYLYNDILKAYMDKWYKKREAEGNLGFSVFDRIILHNQKCKSEGRLDDILQLQEVVGFVNIMQFTGTDTSQNTTKMVICKMADRQDLKDLLNTINEDIFDKNGITDNSRLNDHETLGLWLKETLRLYNPAARVVPRIARCDLVLKDLRIRKGDAVSVNYAGLMFKEEVFPEHNTFKIERFTKENEKQHPKYQYIPFFLGKRNCLGKHLAELMVKLITCHFCRAYDFKTPAGLDYYIENVMITHMANPLVDVRLKCMIS